MSIVVISILGITTSSFAQSNLSHDALCQAATTKKDGLIAWLGGYTSPNIFALEAFKRGLNCNVTFRDMRNLDNKVICDNVSSYLALREYPNNIFKVKRYIALKEANYRGLDCNAIENNNNNNTDSNNTFLTEINNEIKKNKIKITPIINKKKYGKEIYEKFIKNEIKFISKYPKCNRTDYLDNCWSINSFANGKKYIGEWSNNSITGHGIVILPDGTIEEGYFSGGKLVHKIDKFVRPYANIADSSICFKATILSGDTKIWNGKSDSFVIEAKLRGLNCGVISKNSIIAHNNVNNNLLTSPKKLSDNLLCMNALKKSVGAYIYEWSENPKDYKYIVEAKKRKLSCGVNKEKYKKNVASNKSKNSANRPLASVSDSIVCYNATTSSGGRKVWNDRNENFVGEANYRGLDCGLDKNYSKELLANPSVWC